MKILFAYRGFDKIPGGVEKMATLIMNQMAQRGHEIHLITWDNTDSECFYPMESSVTWHKIGDGKFTERATWKTRIKRALAFRKTVKSIKPDVIMAFQDSMFLNALLYTFGMNIPLLGAERSALTRFDHIKNKAHLKNLFRMYRFSQFVTVQFDSYKQYFPQHLQPKLRVIHNPVYQPKAYGEKDLPEKPSKIILCVGRYSYQKRQSIMIEAFKNLADEFPDWNIHLIGDGEDWEKLKHEISAAGLEKRILLLGPKTDVGPHLKTADLFCLPSRFEGFPNALAEALAYGVPSIGYEGCAGVRDLIEHGENGILVPGNGEVDTLREGFRTMMSMPQEELTIMGEAAKKITVKYNPDEIFDTWEGLFKQYA